MHSLEKLQKLTLGLIIAVVWFDMLCFVVMFIGNIFKWSFLSETFSTGFFTAFGVSLGALFALGMLHSTLTFSLASFSLRKIAAAVEKDKESDEVISQKGKGFFIKGIALAIGSIAVIVIFLWFGEVSVNRHKIKVALNSLDSVTKSPLADKAVDLINKDASVKELREVRDAMLNTLEDSRGLSLLIPVDKIDKTRYYEITPWWWFEKEEEAKPISQANLRVFVPYAEEKNKFNELLKDKKPFSILRRDSLRVFYPAVVNETTEFILLLDTSRQASDAYLLKRSSRSR